VPGWSQTQKPSHWGSVSVNERGEGGHSRVEGSYLWWGQLGLRAGRWGSTDVQGWGDLGGKLKTEPPGPGFCERNVGRLRFG